METMGATTTSTMITTMMIITMARETDKALKEILEKICV
jgi:hypothetical protein